MSLQSNRRTFAGHEMACNAALTSADGVRYYCEVYLSRITWAIEAVCSRVQEDGSFVEVFHNYVARGVLTNTTLPLDSPKIIARGSHFIVHWLQNDEAPDPPPLGQPPGTRNWALWRATMDMEAFSVTSWTNQGSVALFETSILYDVAPVLEHATDFVVTRHTAVDEITIGRYFALDWLDTVWLEIYNIEPEIGHVLGIYAHDTDNDCVITYESGSALGQLWSTRVDADDGGNETSVQTMADFDAYTGEFLASWVQAGHCRVGTNRVAVVAECLEGFNASLSESTPGAEWVHHVIYREINSDTAARVGNEHWAANLHMMSRPWSYASGTAFTGSTPNVYVVLGYRSIVEGQEWAQSYAFACNLDYAMWNVIESGAGLRPRPIGTYYTLGIPDTRASGWTPEVGDVHLGGPTKRQNHISHVAGAPPSGPDIKTRTIAMIAFAKFGTQRDLVQPPGGGSPVPLSTTGPERATAGWMTVYMEDPWLAYRDASDPEQPVANFSAAYSRAMHQSAPAGKGLFVGGGTPAFYDGRQMVECGFPWRPEIFASGTSTGGDLTINGLYQWYAVYTWTDRNGTTHRSAPSNVFELTLPENDNAVQLAVRCVTISMKDADAFYPLTPAINIELYRTPTLNTQFYRVYGGADSGAMAPFRVKDTPANDPETLRGWVQVDDGVDDSDLVFQGLGPYQYSAGTTFGEPIPITIPAMSVVTAHQNRVFGASSIDAAVILYSDELSPDFGTDFYSAPVFASGQFYRIGEIGEITAMQTMNNSLIVFSSNRIYALNCTDAGSGLLSISQELIHEAVGCIEPRSVVLIPQGIMFLSAKGYYLLGRSREAGYYTLARSRDEAFSAAGAAVEDDIREGGNIRSATLLENRHQVRLVTNGRPVTTQTWTFTITVDGEDSTGAWGISGFPVAVSTLLGPGLSSSDVADALAAAVTALVAADPPEDTLRWQVESVTSPTNTVVVTLVGDVELTLAGIEPAVGASTNVASVVTEIETRPRVLIYDYLVQQWSRGELPQTHVGDTRLSELVDGCEWRGDGESLHVVLAQGGILIERRRDSGALEFVDQSNGGNVGIPLDITLAWLHIAGVSGAQRLYEVAVQTERFTQAPVFAELEYDFDGSYTGQAIAPTTYTWPRTGETTTPADLRIPPRQQRARAHRLRIYESSIVVSGETFAIVAMTATVGVESGKKRVASTQRGEV